MLYDPERHHRRSIRLPGYDYRQCGAYFVTICTHGRETLLGEVQDGCMILSAYGRLVAWCWGCLPRHFPGIELGPVVVMPNHTHGIIYIGGEGEACRGEAFGCRGSQPGEESRPNASPLQRRARGTQPGSLGAIVQSLKSVSARKINRMRRTPGAPVWQRNYYEHINRSQDEAQGIAEYIVDNPLHWETDEENPRRCRARV